MRRVGTVFRNEAPSCPSRYLDSFKCLSIAVSTRFGYQTHKAYEREGDDEQPDTVAGLSNLNGCGGSQKFHADNRKPLPVAGYGLHDDDMPDPESRSIGSTPGRPFGESV